jgi:hypothetical protein
MIQVYPQRSPEFGWRMGRMVRILSVVDVVTRECPARSDRCRSLQASPDSKTSIGAKTARLVLEINRYFVAAPKDGGKKRRGLGLRSSIDKLEITNQ